MMEKDKIGAAFTRAAAAYDTLAVFQRRVCQRMQCLLPEWLPAGWRPGCLLDGGCGTGFGAQSLAALWPEASLTGCDLSEAMLQCMHRKGFHAVPGDLEALPFGENRFDLFWSSLAMQWCRPEKVFREAYRVLAPGGILYFSTLAPGTLPEIAHAFEGVDETNRVRDFHSPDVLEHDLSLAGFGQIRLIKETHTLYYPDVRSALESVRGIGAGYTAGKRQALLGKTAWKAIQTRYESLRTAEGLPVSYMLVIGYGVADKTPVLSA